MPDKSAVVADRAWEARADGRILVCFGPHLESTLDHGVVRDLLRRRRTWGAAWNSDHDDGETCPWYSYVRDTAQYGFNNISSKYSRKNTRRRLKDSASTSPDGRRHRHIRCPE